MRAPKANAIAVRPQPVRSTAAGEPLGALGLAESAQETLPVRAGIHREPDEEAVGPDGMLEFHWEP